MELKTLKHIENNPGCICESCSKDIKKEAIKHYLWLSSNINPNELYEKMKSSREAYTLVKDKDQLEEFDYMRVNYLIMERKAIIGWIEHFFNITNNDLNRKKVK